MYLLNFLIFVTFFHSHLAVQQMWNNTDVNSDVAKLAVNNVLRLMDINDNKLGILNGTRCVCCIQYMNIYNYNDYNMAFGVCKNTNSTRQLDDEDYPVKDEEAANAPPCPCKDAYFPSWTDKDPDQYRPNQCQYCTAHAVYTSERFNRITHECNPVGERNEKSKYPPHCAGVCAWDSRPRQP